jgi:hypothetical protein
VIPLQGNAKIELHELDHAGVSTTQTVAYIPEEGALVVGDVVHHKAHAWLEGGIKDGAPKPDLNAWALALDELKAWKGATVYGGRGIPAPVDTAVDDQKAYLAKMEEIIAGYIEGLGPNKVELAGDKAGEHYKAITALAVAAFPDYELSYMIEFGVYGLVNAMAAE